VLTRGLAALIAVLASFALLTVACGSGDASTKAGVTIEPLASRTATPLLGGKPAAQPSPAVGDTNTPATDPTDASPATATPPPDPAEPTAPPESVAPSEGRWIDVDVTAFVVRLMDGDSVVQEIAPVAVGEQVDTGAYLSTQTGLFHIYNKVEGLAYDAPYDTYISHWVGFDPAKDNGFHSFLKDADGNVVDAATGRVSNGCIRTGGAEAIFAFAEIGMPVYVHG
jgi:hypothetical protein